MKRLLTFLAFTPLAYSQATGIIDASRYRDWTSNTGTTIVNRTVTPCIVLDHTVPVGDVGTANSVNWYINNANSPCASAGSVVRFSADTYSLAGVVVQRSNITLRGDSPVTTKVKLTAPYTGTQGNPIPNGGAALVVTNLTGTGVANPDNTAAITNSGAIAQGTTTLTLNTLGGGTGRITDLANGKMIFIDQNDDANVIPTVSFPPTNEAWINATWGSGSTEGAAGINRQDSSTPPITKTQVQAVKISTCVGANSQTCASGLSTAPWTITFTPGLYRGNWNSSKSPGAYWFNDDITGVGIENISLDCTTATTAGACTGLSVVKDSWLKNVRLISPPRAAVWLLNTKNITIRDSYFTRAQSGGSQSYIAETDISCDMLFENNTLETVTVAMIQGESSCGNVYGYNFAINDNYNATADWMQASMQSHSSSNQDTLFEGNESSGLFLDAIHGPGDFITAYRNRLWGWEPGKAEQTDGVKIQGPSRYTNIIGNVIGTDISGVFQHTNYECVPTSRLISSISRTTNVTTVTTSVAHNYSTNDSITIDGVTDTSYNATATITVTGATTFTYANTGANGSSSGGYTRGGSLGASDANCQIAPTNVLYMTGYSDNVARANFTISALTMTVTLSPIKYRINTANTFWNTTYSVAIGAQLSFAGFVNSANNNAISAPMVLTSLTDCDVNGNCPSAVFANATGHVAESNTANTSFNWQVDNDTFSLSHNGSDGSIMRWGNYHSCTNTFFCGNAPSASNDTNGIRWINGEVPTGLSKYANAVPATHDLPVSFYMSGIAVHTGGACTGTGIAWWKGADAICPAFPPIGPDVTSGTLPFSGGHAWKIPAHRYWDTLTLDSDTGLNPSTNQVGITSIAQTGSGVATITTSATVPSAFVATLVVDVSQTAGFTIANATWNHKKYAMISASGTTITLQPDGAWGNCANPCNATATVNPVYAFDATVGYLADVPPLPPGVPTRMTMILGQ